VRATHGENHVSIEFGAEPIAVGERVSVDIVLDKDGSGDVIGVEVINLQHQTSPNVIYPDFELLRSGDGIMATYDGKADALWIDLRPGEGSFDQCAVRGVITLDVEGRLAKLDAPAR